MFEKASSITPQMIRNRAADDLMIGSARGDYESALRTGGDALRALDWRELTTRLNAARELRLLLKNDHQKPIGSGAASFSDAAARYFHDEPTGDDYNYEPRVNLNALEPRKASQSIASPSQGNAASGGARETHD